MKLFCYVTESHKRLFWEYLLPTAGAFKVQATFGKQIGSGTWGRQEWCASMIPKVESVCESLANNPGDMFVWSDADVILNGLTPRKIQIAMWPQGVDIAAQEDDGCLCAGFFAMRASRRAADFYNKVLSRMGELTRAEQTNTEQLLFNEEVYRMPVKVNALPRDEFSCPGHFLGSAWSGGRESLRKIKLSACCKMFHANYAVGISRKIRLLNHARSQFQSGPTTCATESL